MARKLFVGGREAEELEEFPVRVRHGNRRERKYWGQNLSRRLNAEGAEAGEAQRSRRERR
jgi:hypothetical protein